MPRYTQLPPWTYLDGENIAGNGAAQNASIPEEATIFHIVADGGAVSYEINGTATATSPGWVPENGRVVEGPLNNIDTLSIFHANGVNAHIEYYAEVGVK